MRPAGGPFPVARSAVSTTTSHDRRGGRPRPRARAAGERRDRSARRSVRLAPAPLCPRRDRPDPCAARCARSAAHAVISIVESLRDPRLLGAHPAFEDLSTWSRWIVFLKTLYGLALDNEELAIFRAHTARVEPNPTGYAEAALITGRQSGKSIVAAAIICHEALFAEAAHGEEFSLLVSQDLRGAQRVLFGFVESF